MIQQFACMRPGECKADERSNLSTPLFEDREAFGSIDIQCLQEA